MKDAKAWLCKRKNCFVANSLIHTNLFVSKVFLVVTLNDLDLSPGLLTCYICVHFDKQSYLSLDHCFRRGLSLACYVALPYLCILAAIASGPTLVIFFSVNFLPQFSYN